MLCFGRCNMSEVTFDAANFSEQYEDYKTISWPEPQ